MKPRTVYGPKAWSFDVALSRGFQLREMQRLDFRVEAYNLTNSFRPDYSMQTGLNTSQNNQLFGVIRAAQDPRILQFALKYVF